MYDAYATCMAMLFLVPVLVLPVWIYSYDTPRQGCIAVTLGIICTFLTPQHTLLQECGGLTAWSKATCHWIPRGVSSGWTLLPSSWRQVCLELDLGIRLHVCCRICLICRSLSLQHLFAIGHNT
jgi:hypothetical protein